MNVMVAGGSGFLGQHLVSELTSRGHRVAVLSRGTRKANDTDDVECIACDVAAGKLPLERMRDCDAIVNLIGIKRQSGGWFCRSPFSGLSRFGFRFAFYSP